MLTNFLKFKEIKTIAMFMAIVLILLVFSWAFYVIYFPINVGNAPISVVVGEGSGLRNIAMSLKKNELIRSELAFMSYVNLIGEGTNLKAGKYNFSGRLDVPDIVFILVKGLAESDDIRLLISEGFNMWEIDERLVMLDLISEGEFSSEFYRDEGYLFPDTYRINRKFGLSNEQDGSQNFIQELRERMNDNFNSKTAQFLGGLSMAESQEIIIIASILEKEARSEADMKLVSGIIRNRLSLGMLLQIDATVIYGACFRIFNEVRIMNQETIIKNCDVTFQGVANELKIDGPYNTYTRKGLPPAPISNPGLKAIEAALNPTDSDYLYYLSTRDGSQLIYSKTAGEHVGNRRKYLGI